jgi:energy-coupling factor transporter ATP-binding protein EcfA2
MLKLTRLRVERFRSLARGTELSFSDGINVLLGQNGTGKTTLLELISMVVRSDFSSLAKEEFAVEYELAVPESESIIVVVRNNRMDMEQQTPVELGAREVFQPSAEVFAGSDRRLLVKYDSEHGISLGQAEPVGSAGILSPINPGFLFLFIAQVKEFTGRYLHSLVQGGNAHRLDESLEVFKRITSAEIPLGDIIVGDDAWVASPFTPTLVPNSIVLQLEESYQSTKPDYSLKHGGLNWLAALKDMMGFTAADLRVDVTAQRKPVGMRLENLVFRFWWEDGAFITHERLSYGQKRLVTFFYYLACNWHIVIADELVNGLHHRWITTSIEAIGQRQAFLTSQNPLLLDYIPITSAVEVRRSFVLCRGEPRAGRPGWIWENMSDEDASELFRAYEVGVEHVSEILQSRGLW